MSDEDDDVGTRPLFGKDLPLGKFVVYERMYSMLDTA
jgi:hypothetical protein